MGYPTLFLMMLTGSVFINSKEASCLRWFVMIKPAAKNIHAYSIDCPLDIAKGLPEGVAAIIAVESNTANPFFDEVVDVLFGQGFLGVPTIK